MKKGKTGLAIFSAAVLIAIVLMAIHTAPDPVSSAPVQIRAGSQTLDVWTEDGENYYAFLPGHIQLSQAEVLPIQDAVMLEGTPLPVFCDLLECDKPYGLTWEDGGQSYRGTLQVLTSGGVATLYVNTQSGSMDYIHEQKGNAERGSVVLYDEAGNLDYSGSLETIRGRGNSTWVVHEKKPYSLKLMDEADLLGMGAAKDWILLADALDSSAMRNKIVYDFAARAGLVYTPDSRWTEVYLNGAYAGVYLLCEKVEVDPQRVDLTPDGSLVCMDRDIRVEEDVTPYFATESGQYLQVQESSDYGALRDLFQSMENAVLAEDGVDPVTGRSWQELIDLGSWVQKYLVEELFGSYDANFQSQYFYCYETEPEGKVYAGPIWDYDASLGNPSVWALNSPRGLFAWRPEAVVGYATPWFRNLYEKDGFREALKEEYRTVFQPLLQKLLTETIGQYEAVLAAPFARNQIRWNVETGGIHAEAEYIAGYLQERMEFLSRLWLEEEEFYVVRLQENQTDGYYAYYAVEPGTCFEDLPARNEADFLGWYRQDTDTLFDCAELITQDIELYPKYENGEAVKQNQNESFMDLFLKVYQYVPGAVLVLMGLVVLRVSLWKPRGRKKEKNGSKV